MSGGMWNAVETKTWKTRVAKIEEREEEGKKKNKRRKKNKQKREG